jgi:2'-5' RNA ligase
MIKTVERNVRSFVAIELPQELRSALRALTAPLQSLSLNVKWVPESNYHLTLKFLGDVAENDLGAIGDRLQTLTDRSGFTLSLDGWGMFPNAKRPSVFWVGLGGELDALRQLWQEMEDSLSAGGYPRDSRWHPHITLGRFRSQEHVGNLITRLQQAPSYEQIGSFTASGISLMESRLSPAGPAYRQLSCLAFKQ